MYQFIISIYNLLGLRLFKIVLFLIIGGILEGFAILLLVPILNFSMKIEVDESGIISIINKIFALINIDFTLGSGLILFFIVYVIQITFFYLKESNIADTISNVRLTIRRNLYVALLKSEWVYIAKKKRGKLVSAIVNDSEKAGNAVSSFLLLLSSLIIAIVYTSTAIIIAPAFTIGMLSTALIFFILFKKYISIGKDFGVLSSEANSNLQVVLNEHFDAMKLIKGTALFELSEQSIKNAAKTIADVEKNVLKHHAKLKSLSEPFVIALLTIGIYCAITFININVAELFVVLLIFLRLLPKGIHLSQMFFQVLVFKPSYEKVLSFTKEANENSEKYLETGASFISIKKELKIKDVSFEYSPGIKVIKDLNLNIKKGETIAIVGESGSGKSTLTDLILGLIQPQSGSISLDGKLIKDIEMSSYRKKIGYVSQDTILNHDTIKNNILWGNDYDHDEKSLGKICRLTHIEKFVSKMPNQYETIIGDRGAMLSGGQRQRLAIARAVARNPEILILDEATSALDSESERLIQKSIDNLSGEIAIMIIIAHRLSTVVNADRIVVLENGSIVESGTFEYLLSFDGYFKSLYESYIQGS